MVWFRVRATRAQQPLCATATPDYGNTICYDSSTQNHKRLLHFEHKEYHCKLTFNMPTFAHLVHIEYANELVKGAVQFVQKAHHNGRRHLLGHAGEADDVSEQNCDLGGPIWKKMSPC